MRILSFATKNFADELAAFCRTAGASKEMSDSVAAILADVRERGDAAIAYYAAKFDGAKLAPRNFIVKPDDLAAAAKRLAPADKKAILAAHESVLAFNAKSLPKNWTGKNPQGAEVGEVHHPLRRVGINVPRGQVPLPSTAIMTITLAKLAGVPQIAVFTPCDSSGRVADILLATFHLCGVTEVYRVGGVYGVGAMAFGTTSIPAVDKIFGPSNAYVCEAMRQVFGTVGVAGLPGPSEVMILADETARPDFAASDLLAQAEHGSGKEKIYLVGTSRAVIDAIHREVQSQLKLLKRAEQLRHALQHGFLSIEVASLAQAVEVANYIAPEHLELLVKDGAVKSLVRELTTAGAIMVGNYTPTALGDFIAGPSHVLPTGRTGRFFSGLRVADFMRRTSVIRYDKAALKKAAPTVAAFAQMEQLDAHGRSVEIRTR
ncbi:MAG: histidinol dehydrogenase [Opitutae bacterium]|nr:histidinol dehydrogenase [Opitutae bacterium]